MELLIRKHRIVFATVTLSEILRHFSRKDLSQQIYLVNRQHYSVATSNSHVPVIHFIEKINFDWMVENGESTGVVESVRIGKDRLKDYWLESQIGTPGLFVRFGQVTLKHLQGQAMLKFLREARDNFIGCKLNISVVDCLKLVGISQSYVREQVRYLLQNIFHSPLSVTICDQNWYDPESIIESKGCSNCCRLELHFKRKSARCNEITNRALLEWLDSGYKMQSDMSICEKNVQKKHLDFEYVRLHNTEFVITFIQWRASPLQLLEAFDKLSLDKTLTAERLSFLKYSPPNSKTHNRAYRLWRRSVTSEATDSARLSFLQSEE